MQTGLLRVPRLVIALTLMTLTVTGCKTVSLSDYCSLYSPVYTRDTDRQELRDNVNKNNAVWLELCENADG